MQKNKYADVVIDITNEHVDRPFTYAVPESLMDSVRPGMPVLVPFGNGGRKKTGYILDLKEETELDPARIKEILGPVEEAVTAESTLIALAVWMHSHYGCMLNQALRTVMPVRNRVAVRKSRVIRSCLGETELRTFAAEMQRKHRTAMARLTEALADSGGTLSYGEASGRLSVGTAVFRNLEKQGVIKVEERAGITEPLPARPGIVLTEEQAAAAEIFRADLAAGKQGKYLLFGITGSGKTEVYAEMIREVLARGRQVILLIPEISLTFQTVERMRGFFGDRVAILHSRLSDGERFEQFRRAAEGSADIMIGPRSALFAPFSDLGLIIIDEEHDGAYRSDTVPCYEARDVAEKRAELCGASLVLGSATPSTASFRKASRGEYRLLTLTKRAVQGAMPAEVHVADLREELKSGNRSVFSRILQEKIKDRLSRKEQVILFMNRRGYSSFVSCRSCGQAIRCPHCDVTLKLHTGGRLMCHYCGHTETMPEKCPSCGSPYIAGFGTGTQKLEELTRKMFPGARVVRMDADAAAGKNAARDILKEFAEGRADILIGTQMVVKGHDFPNVTLVGIMAADTELYVSRYDSAERTFQLLTQAAGRAGRGNRPGDVVIQTYRPEHYAVQSAAAQDYLDFFRNEIAFRETGGYPPAMHMLAIQLSSLDEELLDRAARTYADELFRAGLPLGTMQIGPVNAPVYKVHDYFRKWIYIKHSSYDILVTVKNGTETAFREAFPKGVSALYDFS